MKKILLVGVNSVHTFNYYELIKESVDDIVLITDKRNEKFPELEQHLVNFSMRNFVAAAFSISKIRTVIKRFSPDLIHVHLANSCAYYTLRANKNNHIPVLVTAWGSEVLVNPLKSRIIRKMLKYIVQSADAFTVDATIVGEYLKRYAGGKDLRILNSIFGVQIPQFREEKERVFYSNRLHEANYRIENIILAFHKFPDKRWRLRIAGTGSTTSILQKLCERLGLSERVDFLGWLEKKENYMEYSRAMVYVSVPKSDATSISVMEAMANGCLPVTSDLAAMREWIKHGVNGYLVSNADSDFLTEALDHNWHDLERVNRNLIMQNASVEVCRKRFISFYDELIG